MRVAFATAHLPALIGLIWIFWDKRGLRSGPVLLGVDGRHRSIAGQVPHSKISSQALSLIPTFILIGYLAYHAGLTKRAVRGGAALGGLGCRAGSPSPPCSPPPDSPPSPARRSPPPPSSRAMAIPEMLKIGYDKALRRRRCGGRRHAGLPHSAFRDLLVIYAIIVEQDVGKLLLAGFIPGVFSAVIYAALIVGLAHGRSKTIGPPVGGFSWRRAARSALPGDLPDLFRSSSSSSCSSTTRSADRRLGHADRRRRASALSSCSCWRPRAWDALAGAARSALIETAKLSVMIFTIIWGVLIYVRFLGFADLPSAFCGLDRLSSIKSPMLTLVMILLAYAVLGMFMDAIGMMLLTLAGGLSGGDGAQWRRGCHGGRERFRHVGRRCAPSGSASWW